MVMGIRVVVRRELLLVVVALEALLRQQLHMLMVDVATRVVIRDPLYRSRSENCASNPAVRSVLCL